MQISRRKQFFVTFAAFVVLGAAFKVMVLVEGFTEVRPVNAIPPVAGLAFGWVGAIACGIGNLAADLFGGFGWSSVLGVIANFVAAYLPYRLWHLFSNEAPNVRSRKNILLYLLICLISAFTVAWFLSFGLYTFFGLWIAQIYVYVFFNNLGFSVMFGLPLLIILTSDSVSIQCRKRSGHILLGKLLGIKLKKPVCAVYLLLMTVIFVCVFFAGMNPKDASWLHVLSALSLAGLVCQIL
ncbi:MAG: QueT transporter family protein [Oscillospiraceae bacterium]|nr:QueT transporter family protein [Oscillospiraceae bacterium]